MELIALDKDFVPIGRTRLTYTDLSWNRKYYESGQFSLQIPAGDYSSDMAYIYTKDRPELGMVQCVQYTDSDYMVVLSGFFYEKKLGDKIVFPVFTGYGNRAFLARRMITEYKADIPKVQLGSFADEGEKIQKQETGAELETAVRLMLQAEEKALRCRYDYINDIVYADIWRGADRTQSQGVNNFVTFSKGFRNLKNVSAKDDNSNFKNYAVVGGSGEGDERIYTVVDLSGGRYRQQLFVDAKNEKYDPEKQTLEEYRAALYQKGMEKLQAFVDIHNVEFDALADGGFKYLADYDLGDKCDIIIEELHKSYEARIIEISETWCRGIHTVTLTFGDKIPTLYERAKVR